MPREWCYTGSPSYTRGSPGRLYRISGVVKDRVVIHIPRAMGCICSCARADVPQCLMSRERLEGLCWILVCDYGPTSDAFALRVGYIVLTCVPLVHFTHAEIWCVVGPINCVFYAAMSRGYLYVRKCKYISCLCTPARSSSGGRLTGLLTRAREGGGRFCSPLCFRRYHTNYSPDFYEPFST